MMKILQIEIEENKITENSTNFSANKLEKLDNFKFFSILRKIDDVFSLIFCFLIKIE